MTAALLLVTEVHTTALDDVLERWRTNGVLYRGVEESCVLELTPLAGLAELDACTDRWDEQHKVLSPLLAQDVRRQVLRFVAAPKSVHGDLPDTAYLQLRHVEVKPPVHEEYLAWR